MNLILLNAAIEALGVTNVEAFKRDAKRYGCWFERAGIVKIDADKFHTAMDADFAKDAEAALAPKTKTRSAGSDLGIVMARLAQDAKRRAAKVKKIADIKEAIKGATTAYESDKFHRELKKLEGELTHHDERHAVDERRRDEILNAPIEGNSHKS